MGPKSILEHFLCVTCKNSRSSDKQSLMWDLTCKKCNSYEKKGWGEEKEELEEMSTLMAACP